MVYAANPAWDMVLCTRSVHAMHAAFAAHYVYCLQSRLRREESQKKPERRDLIECFPALPSSRSGVASTATPLDRDDTGLRDARASTWRVPYPPASTLSRALQQCVISSMVARMRASHPVPPSYAGRCVAAERARPGGHVPITRPGRNRGWPSANRPAPPLIAIVTQVHDRCEAGRGHCFCSDTAQDATATAQDTARHLAGHRNRSGRPLPHNTRTRTPHCHKSQFKWNKILLI